MSADAGGMHELIVGRLIEHGPANYQFRAEEGPSYFVKLQTDRGTRVLWGKDLPRALANSQTHVQVDDMVGVQRRGREAVTVLEKQRDSQGNVVAQREQQAHRNQWLVEKIQFFTQRARMARRIREEGEDARAAMREHPELRSTFLSLRAAEALAEKKIAQPEDRKKFLALLREAMASSIEAGQALPSVQIRDQKKKTGKMDRTR